MNNIKFFLTMTTALILMGSCGNKGSQQQVPNEAENDTVTASINCDSTIYGLCAAESTMNTLELIADSGDTLHICLKPRKRERSSADMLSATALLSCSTKTVRQPGW